MKRNLLAILATLAFGQAFSQGKPELPSNFYDNFSYTLPPGFNFNDFMQIKKEADKMSSAVMSMLDSAENNFTIKDSTLLYYQSDWRVTASCQQGKYQEAADGIAKCRKMKPTPVYTLPYGLINLAYASACLKHTDDGSEEFRKIYSQSLQLQFNNIPADFRNDIISQQKGSFNKASVETFRKQLERNFSQAIDNSNRKLDFDGAVTLLKNYQAYYQRKNFQPVIEQVLYAISPAIVKEEQVKIPMRDGIRLNGYVYRNEAAGEKLPAIVSLSPYPSGFEANRGNVFAVNGYIYVYVDTRGRRESEGTYMPYEDDARDFYDIIDWVSKQPWCNGKVATSGGSYLGFDQWQTIRKEYKHPALKAINPMVAVGFGVDFPRSCNMFYPYILQWAVYVSGKELNNALFNDNKFWNDKNYELYKNRIAFEKLDSVVGMPNAFFQKWVSHPDFDDYWKNILPKKEDYAAIDIPVLSITGYHDADQVGAMYYYDNHMRYGNEKAKAQHYLLIGPYEHGAAQWQPSQIQNGEDLEPAAQIPIYKYVIKWFDWVLKGKEKPAFLKDKINYFETGNNTWKGTPSLKDLSADSLVLYLSPAEKNNHFRKDLHSLGLQRPVGNDKLIYRHDIAAALDSTFLFTSAEPYDDSLYMTSPYNMVFESEPLDKDIVMSNKIIARMFMTLNVPDADFEWMLYEITPDGKSKIITSDYIRARYRNGGEHPELAKAGEVVDLNFENAFIFIKKINKGSKLRFEFQSSNHPWEEKNYGFGGVVAKESTDKPRIIEAQLLMNKTNASRIIIPIAKK